MFLIIVAVSEIGDYIENNFSGYSCPSYCGIEHEHIIIEVIENEYTSIDSGLFIQPSEQGTVAEGIE
jgi:hypothetical protein